jgi:uncharacterized protein YcbX
VNPSGRKKSPMPASSHPVLDRITLHPFKSLDGMEVQEATISTGGCLLHDREFALRDRDWSRLREHPHAYYLAVDCLIPASEVGKLLRVGDPLVIVDSRVPRGG